MMKIPSSLILNKAKTQLSITFDEIEYHLSAEYLRVYSPSAEVRGHAHGQEILQVGKEGVTIQKIKPVGTYAVSLGFSDDHDTGIYSWEVLYSLASHQDKMWADYLTRLEEAGHTRVENSTANKANNINAKIDLNMPKTYKP